jgi:hypothetical protein
MLSSPTRILTRLSNRLRRARPGSVLIIVIVLLLLLAILGAAYISTTRSARVASAQNVLSADVDSMINGLAKMCEGVIVDDLNDSFGNLRGNSANLNNAAIVNRSYYQGEVLGAGGAPAPNININVPGGPASPTFNPGDIVTSSRYGNASAGGVYFYDPLNGTPSQKPDVSIPGSAGWQVMNGGLPFTAIGADPWLADRIPDPDGTRNVACWTGVTQTIGVDSKSGGTVFSLSARSILGTVFDDPTFLYRNPAETSSSPLPQDSPMMGGMPGDVTPLYVQYLGSGSTNGQYNPGTNVPALGYTPGYTANTTYAAGDADGDGIADSFLFRIPGANYDGYTWYGAVRIVDNNSAINANTAWSRDTDYFYSAGAGGAPNLWNLFQTSVGLQEAVNANGDSMAKVVTYRSGTGNSGTVANAWDDAPAYGNAAPKAFNRSAAPSATTPGDYQFVSQTEALYQQLIRRINNPGFNSGGAARYQPFPLADETSLAYHFCLQNSSGPSSVLEAILSKSLTPKAGSSPYDASNSGGWFNDNFTYGAGDAIPNLRPFLVTRNPVSNMIQQVYNNNTASVNGASASSDPLLPNYMLSYSSNTTAGSAYGHFRGQWSDKVGYNVGDSVVFPGPTPPASTVTTFSPTTPYAGPSYTFVCIVAAPAGTAPPAKINNTNVLTAVNTGFWQLQPFTKNAVKANVNTATFPELFRAFWCVMAGNPSYATPFGVTPTDNRIYDNQYDATGTAGTPQAQFRSVLRDPLNPNTANVSLLDAPGAGAGSNTNVMLLRAALAAVNAIGLRENTENVISQTILLNKPAQVDNNGVAENDSVEVEVFSNAPNPVISEVYVNTYAGADSGDASIVNAQGYVAVELYNPYSVPMTLKNWQLGLINRTATAGAAPNPNIYPNLSFQAATPTNVVSPSVIGPIIQAQNDPVNPAGGPPAAGTIIIPAHGFALLENYNPAVGATPNPGDALGRSVGANFFGGTAQQKGPWFGPGGSAKPNTCDVYVQNLQLVIGGTTGSTITATSTGGELVILRPRRSDGNLSTGTVAPNLYSEGSFTTDPLTFKQTIASINIADFVPVDSYDFSGLAIGTAAAGDAWSYVREKCQQAATTPPTPTLDPSVWFKCTFPGFYSTVGVTANQPREGAAMATPGTAHQGITSAAQNPPFTPTGATPNFGTDVPIGSYTNNFPPIQVYNVGNIQTTAAAANNDSMHFPNSVVTPQFNPASNPASPYVNTIVPSAGGNTTTPPFLFPHGGFARNGDMLDIPFIGAYRIRIASGALTQTAVGSQFFFEMNALPKDCSFAAVECSNINAALNATENIGRFVPMAATHTYVNALNSGKFDDGTSAVLPLPDFYAWSRNLFNYLTVQSPSDAHTPNFDPNYSSSNPGLGFFAYPPQNWGGAPANPIGPTPVLTGDPAATDQSSQDSVGVEGLININTASWKVLSLLPFVPSSVAGAQAIDQTIAKNIVTYRLTHGPFTSIFDLNQVPGFQTGSGTFDPTKPTAGASNPSSALGLLSPADPNFGTTAAAYTTPPLGDVEDYQEDCLTLMRISNLVTTRSDTFTVYIEVQGWLNADSPSGGPLPQPVITRHYAFIVDRSAINADPGSRYLKTLTVPNN